MGMVIGTNVASLQAQRHLEASRGDMETSMERLASGNRINSAADDAAGMAIANKIEVKVMGLNQGIRNANDGMSMVQVAEGGMEEIGNILGRMKELAVQAANGTYNSESLTTMNNEYTALATEITRIAETTDFNGVSILNSAVGVNLQVGNDANDAVVVSFQAMKASDIGGTGADIVAIFDKSAVTAATNTGSGAAGSGQVHTYEAIVSGVTPADHSFKLTVANVTYTQEIPTDATGGTAADDLAANLQNGLSALADQISAGGGATAVAAGGVLTITSLPDAAGAFAVGDEVASGTLTTFLTADAGTLGRLDDSEIASAVNAGLAMATIDEALKQVDDYRATLGSISKTLDHTVSNLMNRVESQSAALSRIKDADYAVESANLAKAQVLQQAGTAMLAQANASGEGVLQLLK